MILGFPCSALKLVKASLKTYPTRHLDRSLIETTALQGLDSDSEIASSDFWRFAA